MSPHVCFCKKAYKQNVTITLNEFRRQASKTYDVTYKLTFYPFARKEHEPELFQTIKDDFEKLKKISEQELVKSSFCTEGDMFKPTITWKTQRNENDYLHKKGLRFARILGCTENEDSLRLSHLQL